jgi:hypothetical protein
LCFNVGSLYLKSSIVRIGALYLKSGFVRVGALYLKYGFVMISPYLYVEILEVSSPLTIFEPWIGKLIWPYILKFIFVGLCSHIICVLATFGLCWIILILLYSHCVSLCDSGDNAKTRRFVIIVPHVLQLDLDVQLSVMVPNLVLGARKDLIGRERAFETKRRLVLISKLRLCCKVWKNIVDSTVEYNALRLAAHEYSMGPHALPELCLPREHNLVKLFKLNFMLFSESRHVTSRISKRISRSDLEDLSLRSWAKLRTELKGCYGATEFYDMFFGSIYPYWTWPADRVYMALN